MQWKPIFALENKHNLIKYIFLYIAGYILFGVLIPILSESTLYIVSLMIYAFFREKKYRLANIFFWNIMHKIENICFKEVLLTQNLGHIFCEERNTLTTRFCSYLHHLYSLYLFLLHFCFHFCKGCSVHLSFPMFGEISSE